MHGICQTWSWLGKADVTALLALSQRCVEHICQSGTNLVIPSSTLQLWGVQGFSQLSVCSAEDHNAAYKQLLRNTNCVLHYQPQVVVSSCHVSACLPEKNLSAASDKPPKGDSHYKELGEMCPPGLLMPCVLLLHSINLISSLYFHYSADLLS